MFGTHRKGYAWKAFAVPRRRKDYASAGSYGGSDTGLPIMDSLPTRERGRGTFYDCSFPQ